MAYATSGRAVRGAVAFSFGVAALSAGAVIHVIAIVKNGFGSGDATGVALVFAGPPLILLGIVMLFRAIPRKRYRVAAAPFALVVLLWVVAPLGLATYMTHAPRYEITPQDLGRPYEDVSFETSDGITIHGWYVPSQNGAAVLVAHGSGGARIRPISHARMLVERGYGVLVFDARGHGESDGGTNALGWGAWRDVVAAAVYLDGRADVEDGRIGALGLSMGAEMALEAAAHDVPLDAVVADGAGGRSFNETRSLGFSWKTAFGDSLAAALNVATVALSGTAIPTALEDQVGSITAPTLYISSTQVGEERDLNRIWIDKTTAPSELWELDAPHTGGLRTQPDAYEAKVMSFFEQKLLGGAAR
jgi:pimeloyl-ACP methyl ester carboxylesterase